MKVTFFSAQPYDRLFFDQVNSTVFSCDSYTLDYQQTSLTLESAALAKGSDAVCVFVNDQLHQGVLEILANFGIHLVLLRCAGFNNVDLAAAEALNIKIARVPSYSPEAVAEHTIALMMTLNRQIHRAYNRVREGNFALNGLLGWNIHGKTAGIVGTGQIGLATARILKGFGCHLLGHDPSPSNAFSAMGEYVTLEEVLARSDIVSLHCPLLPSTYHLINARTLPLIKRGAMLINTSRGALIDTKALLASLKSRTLGALAIDVYEQEGPLFFQDHSLEIIDDDLFQRLLSFPNVLMTGHQGFFTSEAMTEIATVTLTNLRDFLQTGRCANQLMPN